MKTEKFSRRERQIMDAIYRLEEGTIATIRDAIPDPPTANAVRTMVQILEQKGHLSRVKRGREFVYSATSSRGMVGKDAFRRVIETFFKGSVEEALAAHFSDRRDRLSEEEVERLTQLIEEARTQEGDA